MESGGSGTRRLAWQGTGAVQPPPAFVRSAVGPPPRPALVVPVLLEGIAAMTAMPVIVGHRGAALCAPENTLGSFRRALDDGALMLECDVHLSADGQIVVMHDETIDRTAAPDSPRRTGAIADLTRAQLDEVVLEDGEKVPSLEELLDLLAERGRTGEQPGVYVEIKASEAGTAVARMLAGKPWAEVISFHPEALAAVRAEAPAVRLGLLADQLTEQHIAAARELRCEMLSLNIEHLTAETRQTVRDMGVPLNVWTINEEPMLVRALELDADTISTDDPAWAIATIRKRSGNEASV